MLRMQQLFLFLLKNVWVGYKLFIISRKVIFFIKNELKNPFFSLLFANCFLLFVQLLTPLTLLRILHTVHPPSPVVLNRRVCSRMENTSSCGSLP